MLTEGFNHRSQNGVKQPNGKNWKLNCPMYLSPDQNLLNLIRLRNLLPPFPAFTAIETLKLNGEMSEFLLDLLFFVGAYGT